MSSGPRPIHDPHAFYPDEEGPEFGGLTEDDSLLDFVGSRPQCFSDHGWTDMDLDKPKKLLTPSELRRAEENLASSIKYGEPRKVWVEDGHVFIEGYDGVIVSMVPAVAIKLGRLLGEAGAASLINQVMQDSAN